jgi:hypothetical protein
MTTDACAILVMRREEDRATPAEATARRDGACRQRLRHAPWGQLLFGDDPALLLLMLIFALVLLTLFQSLWPLLAPILLVGFLLRAWLWCHGKHSEEAASSADGEEEKP